MQETKRQHYVSRTYLKHFSRKENDKCFIGFLNASKFREETIHETNIENICLEKNIYTIPGATPEERMLIENLYSEVFESNYDIVYEILTDPDKIDLTPNERHLIISTVVSMYYRTTNWNRYLGEMTNDILERAYYASVANGKEEFYLENELISFKGKTLDQLQKEFRSRDNSLVALTQIRHILKLIRIRSLTDCIHVIKLEDSDKGFITSDNPVVCLNINGGHIIPIDPSNTLTLALDSKHQLSLWKQDRVDWRHGIYRQTIPKQFCLMPRIANNTGKIENAERFILGSRESLNGFIDDCDKMQNPDEETKRVIKLMDKINQML
jgi:hypothetical protein